MQRLFSSFPSGAPGVALLLLRMCCGASLVIEVVSRAPLPSSQAAIAMASGLAIGLTAGLWTPLLCALAVVGECLLLGSGAAVLETSKLVLDIAQTIALAMLGPGAYSYDAHRFGRRVVVIPK